MSQHEECVPLLRGRLLAMLYALGAALVLVPIFLVRVPCLGDYLNHLARIHVLTTIGGSPALRKFYDPHWQIVPYFGMDVPVALLAQFMGIYTAGRIFVAACVLMPAAAAASLQLAVHRRVGAMPLLGLALGYNFVLALGFLNYLFSAGLAVMLFAAWLATDGWARWRRAALFAPLALLLDLSHIMAFAAYGIMVAATAFWDALRPGNRSSRERLLDLAAAGTQAAGPAALTLLTFGNETFGTAKITHFGTIQDRVGALLSPVYFPGGSGLTLLGFIAVYVLGFFAARPLRLAPVVKPALLATIVAACVAPHMLLNIWGTDLRLPLIAAIVFLGAIAPRPRLGRPHMLAFGCAFTLLLCMRVRDATILLRGLDRQVAAMRQLVTALPLGSRVLLVDGPVDAPGRLAPLGIIEHMALVATIDRDAFMPTLFVDNTPLHLLPAMRNASSPAVNPLTLDQLWDGYRRRAPVGKLPTYREGGQMYWLGWPQKFDFVLLTHFGASPGPLPPDLHQVAGNGVANLYRISN